MPTPQLDGPMGLIQMEKSAPRAGFEPTLLFILGDNGAALINPVTAQVHGVRFLTSTPASILHVFASHISKAHTKNE